MLKENHGCVWRGGGFRPSLSSPLILHAQDRINLGKLSRGESNSNHKNLLIEAGFRNSISLNALAGSPAEH